MSGGTWSFKKGGILPANGHWYYCPACLVVSSVGGRCVGVCADPPPRMKKLYPCTTAQAAWELGGYTALQAMAAHKEGKPIPETPQPRELYGQRADRLIVDDPYVAEARTEEQVKQARAWFETEFPRKP